MNFNLGEFSPELQSLADRAAQLELQINPNTPPHAEASTSGRRKLEFELDLEGINEEQNNIKASSQSVQPNSSPTTMPMMTEQQLAELRA